MIESVHALYSPCVSFTQVGAIPQKRLERSFTRIHVAYLILL
jgi:hypothetical protein